MPYPFKLLFKVQMWSEVLKQQAHRSWVTKRQERYDVKQSFTNGCIRLDKWTLNVFEEDL